MTRSIGIGIIGLGEHAQRSHVDPLEHVEGAHIVLGADPSEEARAAFAYPAVESVDELLAHPQVDAVVVCSPDRFHTSALQAAVAAGKHALVEKPLADERADLLRGAMALRTARQSGLVISSCHPRRYDRPYVWLKQALPRMIERAGAALEIRLDFFYHQPSKGGLHHGLLIDHINHEIDLVHFLVGLDSFQAHKLYDSQIRYAVCGQRSDGISFMFSGNRQLTRRVYSETAVVRFERGIVEVDTETGMATFRDYDTGDVHQVECGTTDYEGRFGAVNENFIQAIRGDAQPYLGEDELLINTEIGIELTLEDRYQFRI